MRQVLFRIPVGQDGWPVYGFGMMLFLAFIACIWLASRRAEKVGISREVIQDLAIWVFVGGILGARTTYILELDPPLDLWDFLRKLPQIWNGGIVLYGALLGAAVSYFIGWAVTFRYRPNVTTLRLIDVVAPTIALGLLLGRFGCFLNGCCYGQVACQASPAVQFPLSAPARYELVAAGYQTAAGFLTDLDRARVLTVEPDSPADRSGLRAGDLIVEANGQPVRDAQALADLLGPGWPRGQNELSLTVTRADERLALPGFVPVTLGLQPTQLYESLSMLLVLILLLAFDAVRRREGQGFAMLMICYGVHRYLNEKLRIDQRPEGFESYVSLALAVAGVGLLLWVSLRKVPAAPSGPVAATA